MLGHRRYDGESQLRGGARNRAPGEFVAAGGVGGLPGRHQSLIRLATAGSLRDLFQLPDETDLSPAWAVLVHRLAHHPANDEND